MDFIKRMSKKNLKILLTIIIVICLLIMIISLIVSGNKKKKCNSLKDEILTITDKYVEENNLLPTLNGNSVTIELSLLDEKVNFKKKEVTGTVTYTKYNDEYIKTFDIENANYCTTDKFGKETDKYDSKNNVKVNVYFNYYTVESYNSKWTSYMPSEDINTEETNGVLLPKDEKDLPTIPDNAVVTEYVRETKTYYSYRDKKWKWYKNNIKYSDYSSTQPKGYNYKDESTLTYTNWSSFKDTSSLTNDNKAYREEKTDTYSRYLIKYDIYSYAVLDEPVTLEELENILGKSYEEISNDKSLKVEVTFKFQNEA